MKFLSIIIPHKNAPEKLRRLLNTIPDRIDIEVIVIDDKSDPDKKAKSIKEDFLDVEFLENPGPDFNAGSARNLGLSVAMGEWLLFADADDYFTTFGITVILQTLKKVPFTCDLVCFSATSYSEVYKKTGTRHLGIERAVRDFIVHGWECSSRYSRPGPVAKAIRRSLTAAKGIRFDSVIASNDAVFSLLVGVWAKDVLVVDKEVYVITEYSDSLTRRLTPERALSRLEVLLRLNNMTRQFGISRKCDWGVRWFLCSLAQVPKWHQVRVYYQFAKDLTVRLMLRFTAARNKRD